MVRGVVHSRPDLSSWDPWAKPRQTRSGSFRFGVYELDLHSGELRKSGARLNLQQQPLQLLSVLLEQPGELVTREELRKRLWPDDTFVDFEHGLNAAVKRLRDTLGRLGRLATFCRDGAAAGLPVYRPDERRRSFNLSAQHSDRESRLQLSFPRVKRGWPFLVAGLVISHWPSLWPTSEDRRGRVLESPHSGAVHEPSRVRRGPRPFSRERQPDRVCLVAGRVDGPIRSLCESDRE